MQDKKLEYFALVDVEKSLGIINKINNTVDAAERIGIVSKKRIYKKTLKGVFLFIFEMAFSRSDFIIIRFSDLVFPLVFFIMLLLRLRGVKIIVDVPTPRTVGIKEIGISVSNPVTCMFRKILTYVSSSWVLFPANLIIQYAQEGKWFEFGNVKKTIKMGNGILIDKKVPLTNAVWPSQSLNLIAVAQLADWHGYDRLLHALFVINNRKAEYKITLTIVGEGEALQSLKDLKEKLRLENVYFTGALTGKDLNDVFEGKHIGVASLGLYRIGLDEASVLKTREYMARGLSVIAGGKDPDFDEGSPYRFIVPNTDEIETLVSILCSFFEYRSIPKQDDVFIYAKNKLSLESKVKKIIYSL